MTIHPVTFPKARAIAATYAEADIPVFLWGDPGVGKSSLVRELAKAAGAIVIDIRLSMFDPVDLRGLPAIVDDKTVWLRPAFWPEHDGTLIYLFFDEMDRAPAAVKNAALQIVLDRRIGEHVLPDSVRIFAAGNGASDRGFAAAMGTALNNRFAHIEMQSDLAAWCAWADRSGVHPAIVAFLEMRGAEKGIFHEMEPGRDQKAFPTPRNWERIAKVISAPAGIRRAVFSGIIGEAPAGEFAAFLDAWAKLPDLRAILRDPGSAPVPGQGELAIHYAIATALARVSTPANFAAVLTYAARLPREFEILTCSAATRRNPDLKNSRAYVDYAARNQAIFA